MIEGVESGSETTIDLLTHRHADCGITNQTQLPNTMNAMSTLKHIFLREGSYYEVEANCREPIDNLTPINVIKLEPKDVILTGKLKGHLEGYFLE